VAKDAKAIIAWGSCASWGCVQAAKPNPTQATPVHKVITDKPIIKVPGCPPIAEVMTGVVTYMLTFDRMPELDRQGRPKMFYSQRIHDKCYRRPHFDAGQFVEHLGRRGRARAATASTRWAARARPPTTPARPRAGTRACQLPDPVRPRLHRLLRGRLLGQGLVLRPPDRHPRLRHRGQRRQGRFVAAGRGRRGIAAHAAVSAIKRAARPQRPGRTPGIAGQGGERQERIIETQGFKLDNSGKRVVVDPITRIEGHLRIEVNLDENNVIRNAVSTGTMWRGLEVILKGRDPRDAWAFVERICGVCTGVHALTSVRAVEDALGSRSPRTRTSSAT
jgi:hypothetical protein